MSAPTKTLLVTGATGFVGSHVLEAYTGHGVSLRALVRKEADALRLEAQGVACVRGSLEDAQALRAAMAGTDAVLHLAAATKARTIDDYQRANVQGTQAVVDAMLAAEPRPNRLVYLSSLAAVGPSRDGRPVTREDSPKPLTAYGRTKLAGEVVCEAAGHELDVAILRAPAVYGPRDRDVFEFFRMANFGVVALPSGPRRLQMIHAADLARALLLAATHDSARGVYHVAEARSYELSEMARMVAEAVGRPRALIVPIPAALLSAAAATSETVAGSFGKSTIFNRDKALELLAPGWLCETELALRDFQFEAQIPLASGVRETAKWYLDNNWL